VQELRSSHHDCVRTMCRISMWHVERYSIKPTESCLAGWGYRPWTHTLRGGSCSGWGMCGGWTGRGCQGSCLQRTAWVPVEEKRVGGRELTWGEGAEKVLKRASHALPSVDDKPTLCAEAPPFVLQSLVFGGSSSVRGALARALSGDGGGASAILCVCCWWLLLSRLLGGLTGLVCQVVCKLRQQQLQHLQRPVPPRVLRRLPQQ
jgi:hypothetical protein